MEDQNGLESSRVDTSKVESFLDQRLRSAHEEDPVVPPDALKEMELRGKIAALEKPLHAIDGVMGLAEDIETANAELTDKLRDALFLGASTALSDCVLGYPGMKNFDERDGQLWIDMFTIQDRYLKGLFKSRSKVPNKQYFGGPSAALDLLGVVETVNYMENNDEDPSSYLKRVADRRARSELGLSPTETNQPEIVSRRDVEFTYLNYNLLGNKISHGRKDLTMADSPIYEYDSTVIDPDPLGK